VRCRDPLVHVRGGFGDALGGRQRARLRGPKRGRRHEGTADIIDRVLNLAGMESRDIGPSSFVDEWS